MTVLPDPTMTADLMTLAEAVARRAATMIGERRPERVLVASTKSSPIDVVTEMDAASETLLRSLIAEARPQDAVLGEEQGTTTGTSDLIWVIDPIDGTVNYLYGLDNYAVSVAVVAGSADPVRWTAVAGAVVRVTDGRTYTAGRGLGAYRDGTRLRVNDARPLAESLVGTGFGYVAQRRAAQGRVMAQVLPQVRDIRRLGSAALDLCLIADGGLDLFFERGLNAWDLAAGGLVALEAGAAVIGLRGAPAGPDFLVAGPPASAEDLAGLLTSLNADTDG